MHLPFWKNVAELDVVCLFLNGNGMSTVGFALLLSVGLEERVFSHKQTNK